MEEQRAQRRTASEGVIVSVRAVAVVLATFQTATFNPPFPPGLALMAWLWLGIFAAVTVWLGVWWHRVRDRYDALTQRRFGCTSLVADGLLASAVTWIYAFDVEASTFIVLYVVAIEGAFRFGMRGALITMTGLTVSYVFRDVWANERYDVELWPVSITFRMGIGFLIAAVAGGMAERARVEHGRLLTALEAERDAAEALRSLDDLRSTFLAAVSHELRTPLTSILGFSITIREYADELKPKTRMMLDQVIAESRQLDRLLQDLLDIERMGRGSVAIVRSDADVTDIADKLAQRLRERHGRRIEIKSDGANAIVDASKVERIIDNLLGNAIKYSPDDSAVILRITRRNGGVHLIVDDEGPGVPESLRVSIFAPFERGSLTSMHQPGTGIGLSLVDRFARLHGGRAWVEDRAEERRGASFHVYLPDGPLGTRMAAVMHEPWGRPSELADD